MRDKREINELAKADLYSRAPYIIYDQYLPFTREYFHKRTYTFHIGYQWTRAFSTDLGFSNEYYFGASNLDMEPLNHAKLNVAISTVESGRQKILRLNYSPLAYKKFRVTASCAYMHSFSRFYGGNYFSFENLLGSINVTDPATGRSRNVISQTRERPYIDLGLRRTFHSIDGRLLLEYQFRPWLRFYMGGGYTHGFNTIAYHNLIYWFEDDPGTRYNTSSAVKGRNYYTCTGLRVFPFVIKKTKKSDKK
jgi:hypothetical protein